MEKKTLCVIKRATVGEIKNIPYCFMSPAVAVFSVLSTLSLNADNGTGDVSVSVFFPPVCAVEIN